MRQLTDPDLILVFADEALLVLDKPAGLLSVPGRGEDKQDCLSRRAQHHFPDALVVHRLDMATSGLMLMARSPDVQRSLSQAFADRSVRKRYIAVVDGKVSAPDQEWGVIDLPIAVDWPNRPRRVISTAGKPSITHWHLASTAAITEPASRHAATRLELSPVTGRSHQLRVHLQALGHAILGDVLYASPEVAARCPRLLLHASQLALTHPKSGEHLCFMSPPAF